ncbi:adenylyl-sulfate kinase [Streptomyces anulatus]
MSPPGRRTLQRAVGWSTLPPASTVTPDERGSGCRAVRVAGGPSGPPVCPARARPGQPRRLHRSENVRRAGAPTMMPARHGVIVLVPVIAPYRAAGDDVRAAHAAAGIGYPEVWADRRWRCACGAT